VKLLLPSLSLVPVSVSKRLLFQMRRKRSFFSKNTFIRYLQYISYQINYIRFIIYFFKYLINLTYIIYLIY